MSALQDLQLFSSISGLRLNNKKTEVLWIGSRAGCKEKLCPEKNLKWVIDKVKSLGVWISTDPGVRMNANFNEKLEKVQNVLSCWKYRRLSLLGKITVLKSLIASQLVYILSPLPTNHRALEEINCIFYNFLWDGKGDKIKRDIMISDYENESLKITDIKSFNKGLKVPLRRKFCIPFSLQLLKVEVINTYHAKFYIEIPTGRPVILNVKFSFVLPPLLDSKNGREPHRELDLVAPRGI